MRSFPPDPSDDWLSTFEAKSSKPTLDPVSTDNLPTPVVYPAELSGINPMDPSSPKPRQGWRKGLKRTKFTDPKQ